MFFLRSGLAVDASKVVDGKTTIRDKCHRCGGQGGSDAWKHTGWKCFRCGGGCWESPKQVPVYSAEKLAKLNATQAKKQAAKAAAAKAKADAAAAEHAQQLGAWMAFYGDLVGKARQYRQQASFLDALLLHLDNGSLWTENQISAAEKVVAQIEAKAQANAASEFIGKVGERLEVQVTVEGVYHFESLYGVTAIVSMRDGQGNIFVVKSTSFRADKGESFLLRGTVKAHDLYRDTKQTVLTRAKVLEG